MYRLSKYICIVTYPTHLVVSRTLEVFSVPSQRALFPWTARVLLKSLEVPESDVHSTWSVLPVILAPQSEKFEKE